MHMKFSSSKTAADPTAKICHRSTLFIAYEQIKCVHSLDFLVNDPIKPKKVTSVNLQKLNAKCTVTTNMTAGSRHIICRIMLKLA